MDRIMKSEKLRPFLAAFCAFGWSMAYPLIKLGYGELNIMASDLGSKILFAGIRFFAAGLLVLLFGIWQKRDMGIRHGAAPILIVFALVNTALHYLFSYIGLSYIPSARSTILDSMGGFLLILCACLIFPDDTMNARKAAGCLLGFCGIVIMNLKPGSSFWENISFRGDGMILLNACCAAGGGILTRFVSRKMDMLAATGYGMVIGGGILIVLGVGFGMDNPWTLTGKAMLILALLILISAVCFGIYNTLLTYHPISKIAIYNALIPVLGVMFSSLLLGEPFLWQYVVAGGMVAVGIILINRK